MGVLSTEGNDMKSKRKKAMRRMEHKRNTKRKRSVPSSHFVSGCGVTGPELGPVNRFESNDGLAGFSALAAMMGLMKR